MQIQQEEAAINAALSGNWEQAITLNQAILKDHPQHIPTLNRLAKAYSQMGKTDHAIKTYEQVLTLDRCNPIAAKQCQSLKKAPCTPHTTNTILTDFIEEPGKTKTTHLVRLGDEKIRSGVQCGQLVKLVVKNHWIAVTTETDVFLGNIADNISFKLKHLMADGNTYEAFVQSSSSKHLSIFIRETFRSEKCGNNPSF
jgi:tetratricopeptide (TPR) repeat protein